MTYGQINLTAAMRANLSALNNTSVLQAQTQQRLSTQKSVNSVLDDAVKFFTADGLNNRANILDSRKTDISNAIQAITAGTNGVTSIKSSINQLQSLVTQARTVAGQSGASAAATRDSVATQFGTLLKQIDNYVNDASYNGTNFLQKSAVTNTLASLTVAFNELATTSLTVTGFDSSAQGLSLTKGGTPTLVTTINATQSVSFGGGNSITKTTAGASTVSFGGVTVAQDATGNTTITAADGSVTNIAIGNVQALSTFTAANGVVGVSQTAGGALTVNYSNDGAAPNAAGELSYVTSAGVGALAVGTLGVYDATGGSTVANTYTFAAANGAALTGTGVTAVGANTAQSAFFATSAYVGNDFANTTQLDALDTALNNALSTLQSNSSILSGNVGILKTRSSFIDNLNSTLTTGAANLVQADVNTESANMLALQTQNQLGISALSLSSQSLQAVLKLF